MKSALFVILKIAGIGLLAVFVVILLLVILLMLVPLRYEVQGSYLGSKFSGKARLCWMQKLLSLDCSIDSELDPDIVLKLCGIRIYDFFGEEDEEAMGEPECAAKSVSRYDESERGREVGRTQKEVREEVREAFLYSQEDTGAEAIKKPTETVKAEELKGALSEQPGGRNIRKAAGKLRKRRRRKPDPGRFLKNKASQVKDFFCRLRESFSQKKKALMKLRRLYRDERYAADVEMAKKKIAIVLRECIPSRCSGYVTVGLGDPYKTAGAAQAAVLLYPLHEGKIEFIPDFDREISEGEIELIGRLRLRLILDAGLRLWFNKRLRIMLKKAGKILSTELLA